jgi:hypothetical protein
MLKTKAHPIRKKPHRELNCVGACFGDAVITQQRLEKYLRITETALSQLKHVSPENSHNSKIAKDFLTMATSYFSDAKHFYKNGKLVDAFACINYAHGWLDAGARLGLWDTGGSELFTV